MGNVALAEELTGADALDELYRLDATETEPEEEDDEDYEDEDEEEGGGVGPHEIPQP
jgi:hypothetical protein